MIRSKIKKNIFFNHIIDKKFKTNRISINLITNITEEKATENALLSYVLSRGNEKYKEYIDFTKKLNDLYGADFFVTIDKLKDKQVLSLSIKGIDNRFSLYKENMIEEITSFLLDTLLLPNLCNGTFSKEVVEIEKGKLEESINSIINDKKEYAHKKAKDLLFKDSKLSVYKYGNITKLKEINNETLTNAYYDLLKNCKIEVMFVGCGDFNIALNVVKDRLINIDNDNFELKNENIDFDSFEFVEDEENLNITQSKISMLYTGFCSKTIEEISIMRMANAVFGGSPFSKLFLNVREKKSLCYYCDSFYDRATGVMSVDCGVNEENIDVAIETINEQIKEIKNKNVSDKEIKEAKLLIINAFNSMKDRLSSIESFYLGQILTDNYYDIDHHINIIKNITKEDVINAFCKCELKVIYKLKK